MDAGVEIRPMNPPVATVQKFKVTPTGKERFFTESNQIIVSKTDLQGRVTYANNVFLYMAACTEEYALGRPHNFVRHPDMPRCVFKLLWDTIASGHELFAYVVNLAMDGAHYWVFAHVTPSFNEKREIIGYHSNRRSPSPMAVEAIKPIYSALAAEEERHESPVTAIEASGALLQKTLNDLGMTYDEFVWSITPKV